PAAVPSDHDDDDGRAVRRPAADAGPGHGLGAAPAARLRHRRRPAAEPDADALYDAGRLSLHGPTQPVADGAANPSCGATQQRIEPQRSGAAIGGRLTATTRQQDRSLPPLPSWIW